MCGFGNAKVKDNEIDIYLGWNGAVLTLNNAQYSPQNAMAKSMTREEMASLLNVLPKKDLIEAMLQIIDNGSDE